MTTPSPDQEKTVRLESDARFPSPRANEQFAPGTIVAGRYRIAGILGSGGMGEVYRADDTKLDQQVALKFLPARLARDPLLLGHMHEEVRLGRQVAHPNVCRIYDIVESAGAHFVAMEYVDGEDLSRLLRRIGRLANDKAVEIARGIAAGLAAAHAKGILHRDLKPANVMIDSHGDARIMDFGLALGAGEDDGTISGTPAYMAPEQIEGQPATVRSDLYALGLVMYELFTGKRAHNARTLPERARDLDSEVTTPSSVIRDIDPMVERVILRCLSHDPAQRPHSAREVIAALPGGDPLAAAMAAGETPSPRFIAAAPIAGSLTRRAAWLLCGGIVLVMAIMAAVAVAGRPLELMGMSKPPEVRAERARELLRSFGIPEHKYTSEGFRENRLYGEWVSKNDRAPNRFEASRRTYPLITFWLRGENQPLVDPNTLGTPEPTMSEPPFVAPGAAVIVLDSENRLFSLNAIPTASWPQRKEDWNALLRTAGLENKRLTPTVPTVLPTGFADTRRAWKTTLEDGAPITIDAAMYRGVPVLFRITAPWDAIDHWSLSFGPRFDLLMTIALVVTVVVGCVLAWRNVRMRRGDRQGAIRIGAAAFVLLLLMRLLVADHEPSVAHELIVLVTSVAGALLRGVVLAVVYLAVEPYLRRRWPDRLVSWSRLLAGNWRDPMVGRDLLIGILVGLLHTLVILATNMWKAYRMIGVFEPSSASPILLARPVQPLALVAQSLVTSIWFAFASMVFLMLLTVVLRRRALAVGAFFLLYFGLLLAGSSDPMGFPSYVLVAAMVTFIVSRYGLLAAAASTAAFFITLMLPMPDQFAWYTVRALVPMACLLALVAWSFRTSLGGQSPFGATTAFDE